MNPHTTLLDKPSSIYQPIFQDRLINFFQTHSPIYLDRIPIILEAYQEHPQLLFGDLDHIYQTRSATRKEKRLWKKEPKTTKNIRCKVAQDYIYRNMKPNSYLSPSERHLYRKAIGL